MATVSTVAPYNVLYSYFARQ